jgi:hypothetical protein
MEKKDTVVAVDIAKSVFDIAVSHEPGGSRRGDVSPGRCSSSSSPRCRRRRW